jgi:DNA helicase-2/ATP-dependent DNA helicase PcrA
MDALDEISPQDLAPGPIDFRSELNEEQYAAVSSEPGPALVLAGAGSGKTRTLTYRVAWLLEKGVRSGEILLLTFTNKASREMLRRVEELTGVAAHRFWGGTFHHIGQKALRMFGEPVGLGRAFNILDRDDSDSMLANCIRKVDPAFLKSKENPKARVIAHLISYARNTRQSIAEAVDARFYTCDGLEELVEAFHAAYAKRKLAEQVADFDDLLDLWLKLMELDPLIADWFQNRFKHLLVDEYQDTNRLQSMIIDLAGAHHRIMAVGDDAQCIYTWRGADFNNIMSFPDRHSGTVIHKIELNYRSTPQILDLANGVLTAQPMGMGYPKVLRPVRESGEIPYVVPVVDSRQQAQFVLRRIDGLLDEGYRYSDIGILYRAHYQALDLQVELSRRGVPFVITSGVRFFEQAHVRDLVAQLRFACNPQDSSAFSRFACLLPRIGDRTAQRLWTLVRDARAEAETTTTGDGAAPILPVASKRSQNGSPEGSARPVTTSGALMLTAGILAKVPADAKDHWTGLAHTLTEIEVAVGHASPEEVVEVAVEGWYREYIRTLFPNWQNRLDDLEGLAGFASRYENMVDLLSQLALLNSETSDRSIDVDDDCLRLTTVHQAKGLEYPVVFVIGMADGLFPLNRAIEEDNLDEERRLFYVAVTRARDELYLSFPQINPHGGGAMRLTASRFLNELPKEHYELLRVHLGSGW